MIVEFGEWLPDLPDFNNPGITEAKNVIPGSSSYLPWNTGEVYSLNALDARCQGAFAAKDKSGVTYNFAGDASKLYSLQSGSYTDVSRTAGYSTEADSFWSFSQFGQDVIATNYNDPMQSRALTSGAKFADVGGDAPRARSVAVVGDFVVALNTFDTDGAVPYRIRWCAIGDPTSWTVNSTTQADYQNLDGSAGDGMQVIGGEYGVILMEEAIYRMDYVGSPNIFQFRQVERARGTPAQNSAVRVGNNVAYLGQDGFYMFDGQQSVPIGANKVDRYFFKYIEASEINRTVAVVDHLRQLIFWVYPDINSNDGSPNAALVFNYSQGSKNKWSRLTNIEVDYIYNFLSEGYTMHDLDNINIELRKIPHPMNSRIWMGGDPFLAGFDLDYKLITFDGDASTDVELETLESQPNPQGLSEIHMLMPLIDSADAAVTVKMGTRNSQGEEVTWSNVFSVDAEGFAPVRSHARFHRARVFVSGDFNDAIGVDVLQVRKAGRR